MRSAFFSIRFARLTSSLPRFSGVSFRHEPSNAFRAAATAISTSFSVASATEQITSSVEGLMVSKVLPSTPLTHSLLMKLDEEYNVSRLVEALECGVHLESPRFPAGGRVEEEQLTGQLVVCICQKMAWRAELKSLWCLAERI